MSDYTIAILVLAATDLLLAAAIGGTTYAAMRGRLDPNQWAGIRTARTLRSDKAWQAAHTAAWPLSRTLCVLCVLGAVGALICLLLRAPEWAFGVGLAPNVIILIAVFPLLRIAGRAADAAES